MTRADRTRGTSPAQKPLPRNPVPVPGTVPALPTVPYAPKTGRAARPGRYTELRGEDRRALLERVQGLARAGFTLGEIGQELGVDTKLLLRWCAEDRAFFEALNPDAHVKAARAEDALFKRAIGYTARKETIKTISKGDVDEKGQPYPDEVQRTVVLEHIAPDPTSAILFLEVYKPEVYRRDKNNFLVIQPQSDHANNPRGLAMALLAILREAAQTTIDLKPEAAE